ncbi:MAG: hypothetical protein J6578_07715 [Snodgrassella sp.]|nr:hypothetical protein [Snodgrassella sp.]MCO6508661.1 hypothetical protein [Snodgrassella sp.]MCO6518943.1 hypothetical protein [Snodgrassella sp.]MCO6520207.1 hypothetical protein [Snodgrassella sp.]MCO6525823.1 hypothetical protein [Snodgrassella sp.]
MNKKLLTIDEKKYPIAWRFNSKDCLLSSAEKSKIVFLDPEESDHLWNMTFPFEHIIKMDSSFFSVIEKINLNFEHPKESSLFFKKRLTDSSLVFFFWSKKASAIIPTDIFVKSWDDFFYPSDETSILFIANRNKMIFSYEETFFYVDILRNYPLKQPSFAEISA